MPDHLIAYAVALGLVAFDILVRALRIRLLLPGQPLGVGQAVAANAYGDAASAITPARLGGDPARFLGLRRYGAATPPAVVALGIERVIDLALAGTVTLAVALTLGGRGFRDLVVLARRLVSPEVLPWLIAVIVMTLVAAVVAYLMRRRIPRGVGHSIRQAVEHARGLSASTLGGAALLTVLSMAARVGVLPVLSLGFVSSLDPVAVVLGSFALIYSQLVLPTPAGAGGVELGFAVGFAPTLSTAEIASLLVVWRVFTLVIPAGLGGVLFVRHLVGRRSTAARPPAGR